MPGELLASLAESPVGSPSFDQRLGPLNGGRGRGSGGEEARRLLDGLAAQLTNALVVVTGVHGTGFDAPRQARHGYGYDLLGPVRALLRAGAVHAPDVPDALQWKRTSRKDGPLRI
ncbi:MAG: hypothetical protein RL385_3225 [Pseudomonadota bacterium]|jgi:hypothetical protein